MDISPLSIKGLLPFHKPVTGESSSSLWQQQQQQQEQQRPVPGVMGPTTLNNDLNRTSVKIDMVSSSSPVTGGILLQQQQQLRLSNNAEEYHSSDEGMKFPFKLHHLLEEADRLGFDDIVSWVPTGDGFRVHNPKAFAAVIMPLYFEMSQYKSFQRQLSLYSFKRSSEQRTRGKCRTEKQHWILTSLGVGHGPTSVR
jgi:hypothetical protein